MGPLVDKFVKDQSNPKKVIRLMNKICEEKIQPFIDASYEELKELATQQNQQLRTKHNADLNMKKKQWSRVLGLFNTNQSAGFLRRLGCLGIGYKYYNKMHCI